MRKPFLTALSAVLCLNFSVCASAAVAEETAVETAVPATEISVADDFYSTEEGGLVPTYTDYTIEPSFTLSEEEYTGAIPEETFKVYPPDYIGGYEIVPATREDGTPIAKYLTMGDLYQAWFENEEYDTTFLRIGDGMAMVPSYQVDMFASTLIPDDVIAKEKELWTYY